MTRNRRIGKSARVLADALGVAYTRGRNLLEVRAFFVEQDGTILRDVNWKESDGGIAYPFRNAD